MAKSFKKSIGRNRMIVMALIVSLLTVTFGAWSITTIINGQVIDAIASTAILVLILALMIPMITRTARSVKKGEPLEDERSRMIKLKAAALSFYVGLYWLLGISFASDYMPGITISSAIGLGILGMAVSWGLSWYYYNKRT